VQRILFSRSIFPVVRKKAALCLLRMVRISRDLMPAEEWSKKLITLLEDVCGATVAHALPRAIGSDNCRRTLAWCCRW
jgi:vesicle coat complex subunit